MHYRVRLVQTLLEETWITVAADSPAAAVAKALSSADDDEPLDWRFVECIGEIEAVQIEPEGV